MKQASRFDGLSFDPFSLFQSGFTAPEVDAGGRQVLLALMVAPMVVVLDDGAGLLPEIAGKVIVFKQVAVLQGLVPSLGPALGLGVVRGTAGPSKI